jgi:hypothetical protein
MLKISIAALAAAALIAGAGMASASSKHRGGGLSFLHKTATEGGKTCFVDHYHHGKGRAASEDEAKLIAGKRWVGLVVAEYGAAWGDWKLAADASMTCVKGERSYRCYAHARPCRY